METYQRESHRLLVEITDMDDNVIDPSGAVVHDIQVFIIHRASFKVVGKYSKIPATGFKSITYVEEPNVGDYLAECILDASQTVDAQQGMYEVQIDSYFADDKFETGYQLVTQKGILMNLNPATNG
jgi:hypothetical protein